MSGPWSPTGFPHPATAPSISDPARGTPGPTAHHGTSARGVRDVGCCGIRNTQRARYNSARDLSGSPPLPARAGVAVMTAASIAHTSATANVLLLGRFRDFPYPSITRRLRNSAGGGHHLLLRQPDRPSDQGPSNDPVRRGRVRRGLARPGPDSAGTSRAARILSEWTCPMGRSTPLHPVGPIRQGLTPAPPASVRPTVPWAHLDLNQGRPHPYQGGSGSSVTW